MFANVYRAMRDVGMANPREVDELELWEIAVLIGADGYKPPHEDKYSHLRARVAYEKQLAAFERGEIDTPPVKPEFFGPGPDGDPFAVIGAMS